jgi:hypothetical protein
MNGRVNTGIAGVLYNQVHSVYAEKTIGGPGFKPGAYRHDYNSTDVMAFALDTGDVLLHSRSGTPLWTPKRRPHG